MTHRLPVLALATSTIVGLGAGRAAAQPTGASRADLPGPALVLPTSCVANVERAAQWFVRELDAGTITAETGPGWRAWRGTTIDDDHTVPVLWVKFEEIDPSSRSSGAVSGWLEIDGAPAGMAVPQRPAAPPDVTPVVLPATHHARSLGRWRLVHALVDGTPKEEAYMIKALDKCAAALLKAPPRRRLSRPP